MEVVLFVIPSGYQNIGGIYIPIEQYMKALESTYPIKVMELSYHPNDKELEKVIFKNITPNCVLIVYGLNQVYATGRYLTKRNICPKKFIALLMDSEYFYAKSITDTVTAKTRFKNSISIFLKRELYRHKEDWCVRNCTSVLYVSKVDMEFVKQSFSKISADLWVIENGVTVKDTITTIEHDFKEFKIGFLSTYSLSVMEENLRPLVEYFMPLILKEIPNVKLVVAGRGIENELKRYLKQYSYVDYIGEVQSLDDFYSKVDIVTPVVKKKNGILNKILEAWGYEKCVIAFDYNFYAFYDAKDGYHYLAAKNFEEMVTIVLNCVSGTIDIDEIGRNARELVISNYNWEVKRKLFLAFINSSLNNH